MALQFSKDGRYYGQISSDGKLKIWNTITNHFEQEFIPNLHLTSPCTCLEFLPLDGGPNNAGSPRKKKRKDSQSSSAPNVALGTSSGVLLVYSIAKADLVQTINGDGSLKISCLSAGSENEVFSGVDTNIFVWNLQKSKIMTKWKTGNMKISSILYIAEKSMLLSASKQIILWDVKKQEKIRTFTGHSSEVSLLEVISHRNRDSALYFLSGSKNDRLLSCWNLGSEENNSCVNFLMEDVVLNLAVLVGSSGGARIATTVRSGVTHVFEHTLNGKCSKTIKPKTTIQIVSDENRNEVTQISISGSCFRDEQTLCIGYGSEIVKVFENIGIAKCPKLECLLRKNPQSVLQTKEKQASKTVTPIVDHDDVHYLTPQTNSIAPKRKVTGQVEIPMETRLENLTLNKVEGASKVPKSDNLAQLLIQGLHSKDKQILITVLYRNDEQIVKNTVKRLPLPAIVPLVKELTSLIQGKTLASQIGSMWLRNLIMTHSGLLLSNPELSELFRPILGSIETRLALQTPLNKLKGRLDLLVQQTSVHGAAEKYENDQELLVFNDKDSNDEDDLGMELQSASENEWTEESSDLEENEDNDENENEEDDNDKMED